MRARVFLLSVCLLGAVASACAVASSATPTARGLAFLRAFVAHDCEALPPMIDKDFAWTQPLLDQDGDVYTVLVTAANISSFCNAGEGVGDTNFTVPQAVDVLNSDGTATSGWFNLHTADAVLVPNANGTKVPCVVVAANPWKVELATPNGLIASLDEAIDAADAIGDFSLRCGLSPAESGERATNFHHQRSPGSLSPLAAASAVYVPTYPPASDPLVAACLAPLANWAAGNCSGAVADLPASFSFVFLGKEPITAKEWEEDCAAARNPSTATSFAIIIGSAAATLNQAVLSGSMFAASADGNGGVAISNFQSAFSCNFAGVPGQSTLTTIIQTTNASP